MAAGLLTATMPVTFRKPATSATHAPKQNPYMLGQPSVPRPACLATPVKAQPCVNGPTHTPQRWQRAPCGDGSPQTAASPQAVLLSQHPSWQHSGGATHLACSTNSARALALCHLLAHLLPPAPLQAGPYLGHCVVGITLVEHVLYSTVGECASLYCTVLY